MIRGVYQSASGLDSLESMQAVIANNLANVSTGGFKKELTAISQAQTSQLQVEKRLDESPGAVQVTDMPLNLAITGTGYFTVQTQQGLAYTRDGNFQVDAEGCLVTKEGFKVQGEKGDIIISDPGVTITPAGEIVSQGEKAEQLKIVSGEGTPQRLGNNLVTWQQEDSIKPIDANQVQILQGALEGSNVNIVESMVDMLKVTRLYEANQKAMQEQDSAIRQAVTDVGRPS